MLLADSQLHVNHLALQKYEVEEQAQEVSLLFFALSSPSLRLVTLQSPSRTSKSMLVTYSSERFVSLTSPIACLEMS